MLETVPGVIALDAIPAADLPPGARVRIRGADGSRWPAVVERTEEARPGLVLVRLEGAAAGVWVPLTEIEGEEAR